MTGWKVQFFERVQSVKGNFEVHANKHCPSLLLHAIHDVHVDATRCLVPCVRLGICSDTGCSCTTQSRIPLQFDHMTYSLLDLLIPPVHNSDSTHITYVYISIFNCTYKHLADSNTTCVNCICTRVNSYIKRLNKTTLYNISFGTNLRSWAFLAHIAISGENKCTIGRPKVN